jgi:hypothetical protein
LKGSWELDVIAEGRGLAEEERMRKDDMSKELEKAILFEEVSCTHKSKALWLREGDKKTKKNHKVANSHRRNNQVESLIINGSMSSNPIEIKEHIVKFYNTCILSRLLGNQGWMVSRSCPLIQMRVFGWRESLRSRKCGKWSRI